MTTLKLRTKKKRLVTQIAGLNNVDIPTDETGLLDMLKKLFTKYKIIGMDISNKKTKCLCGTPSKHNYILKNIDTGNEVFIGNSCVDYFSSLSKNYEDLFKKGEDITKMDLHLKNIKKNFSKMIKNDSKHRYFIYGSYISPRKDKFGQNYTQFKINKVYHEFLRKLIDINDFVNYHYWDFRGEYYIRFKKCNRRFNKGEEYLLGFTLNSNNNKVWENNLLLWKVKHQKAICLIDISSDEEEN